ncbi:unnamed protein product [Caenorhabditis angaria]|uniref:Domain of unknown function DX domain-containing protein n=1 Tax=Caenorhabditis angaria TaxID=860376 RepID=A0A9P1J1N0_9PELO|nr:unnamed protein product [Caenorhabditis angaria]
MLVFLLFIFPLETTARRIAGIAHKENYNYCYIEGYVEKRMLFGKFVNCVPMSATCELPLPRRLLLNETNIDCLRDIESFWFNHTYACAHRIFNRRMSCKDRLKSCYQVMMECFPKTTPKLSLIIAGATIVFIILSIVIILVVCIIDHFRHRGSINIEKIEIKNGRRISGCYDNPACVLTEF